MVSFYFSPYSMIFFAPLSLPQWSAPTYLPAALCLPLVWWSLFVVTLSFFLSVIHNGFSPSCTLCAHSLCLVRFTPIVTSWSTSPFSICEFFFTLSLSNMSLLLSFGLSFSLCVMCMIMGKQIRDFVFLPNWGVFFQCFVNFVLLSIVGFPSCVCGALVSNN